MIQECKTIFLISSPSGETSEIRREYTSFLMVVIMKDYSIFFNILASSKKALFNQLYAREFHDAL